MEMHVCDHLRPVEDYLQSLGRKITSSGQPWTQNCRFWVYFDAVLDCEALKKKFALPDVVEIDGNDDPRSGRERGLVCTADHDAVMGFHPLDKPEAPPLT
jgi:hypothetical protein